MHLQLIIQPAWTSNSKSQTARPLVWTSASRAKVLSLGVECQPGSAKHGLKSNARVNPCIYVRYPCALNSKAARNSGSFDDAESLSLLYPPKWGMPNAPTTAKSKVKICSASMNPGAKIGMRERKQLTDWLG